jgi:hypothetical protein
MIITQFYEGQGLGNQLWVYSVCRTLAMDMQTNFGIQGASRFKGKSFMKLDFGEFVPGQLFDGPSSELPPGIRNYFTEKKIVHPITKAEVSPYDLDVELIQERTKIDGAFQAERYILHRKNEIAIWMKSTRAIAPVSENLCVISFRGGEYQYHSELMLSKEYFEHAIEYMLDDNPETQFIVVTEDPRLARKYFEGMRILANRRFLPPRQFRIKPSSRAIGRDFTWLQNAPRLILSNSSFSWWGAWTNQVASLVIAPKYWARHNVSDGYWSQGDSLTQGWIWLDRFGNFQDYEECRVELERFRKLHPEFSSS